MFVGEDFVKRLLNFEEEKGWKEEEVSVNLEKETSKWKEEAVRTTKRPRNRLARWLT